MNAYTQRRQNANFAILDDLLRRAKRYPDLRFYQLLLSAGIVMPSHEQFNEEPWVTLVSMNSVDEGDDD